MGKDIKEFSGDMHRTLSEYKRSLEEDISYVAKNNTRGDQEKLENTMSRLREYLNLCCQMIDNIPESKKVIGTLKARIKPICDGLAMKKTGEPGVIQAKYIVIQLNKICG